MNKGYGTPVYFQVRHHVDESDEHTLTVSSGA